MESGRAGLHLAKFHETNSLLVEGDRGGFLEELELCYYTGLMT